MTAADKVNREGRKGKRMGFLRNVSVLLQNWQHCTDGREECRLRVFENRVLRRVFGSKRDEVTGEWRKLHNEELNDLYSLLNTLRVVK